MSNYFNTGNPVPSSSPSDLRDNASNLDDAMNGLANTWVDRTGITRISWKGIEVKAQILDNANVAALAGLTGAADRLPYFTGPGALALTPLTSFIRGLLDDTDAKTARATLGVMGAGTAYLEGLIPTWISASALTFTAGRGYLPGVSDTVDAPLIALTGLTALTANTWYHAYLYSNAGTLAIELVTTAPSPIYSGKARSKTGAADRRYLGSFLSNASGGLRNFELDATGIIHYREATNVAPFRVLTAGAATTATNVSAAAVVPLTTKTVLLSVNNNSSSAAVFLSNSQASGDMRAVRGSAQVVANFTTDSSQVLTYRNSVAGSVDLDVYGYGLER